MALKDLISQAQKSKLGKAISNVVSYADRDKQQSGFQFTSPDSFVGQGVRRVTQDVQQNPQRYNLFRQIGSGNIKTGFKPLDFIPQAGSSYINTTFDTAKRSGDILGQRQDLINQRLQGQSFKDRFTTQNLLGLGTPEEAKKLAVGGFQSAKTIAQISSPIKQAGLGALSGGFNAVLGDRSQNLAQRFGSGVAEGVGLSPLLNITNPLTSKLVGAVGGGFLAKQIGQRVVAGLGNVAEDRIIAKLDDKEASINDKLSFVLGAVLGGNDEILSSLKNRFKTNNVDQIIKKLPDTEKVDVVESIRQVIRNRKGQYAVKTDGPEKIPVSGGGTFEPLDQRAKFGQRTFETEAGKQELAKSRLKPTMKNVFGQDIPVPPKGQGGFIDFGAELGVKSKQVYEEVFNSQTPQEAEFNINNILDDIRLRGDKTDFQAFKTALKDYKKQLVTGPGLPRNPEYDRLTKLIETVESTNIKDFSQPKTQLEETISKIKPEKVESSRQRILTKQTQQQKGQLFREAKPVSGGSKIRAIKGEKAVASPLKVSSPVSISRDKKYAFNINKKKLGLNAEQSKELDNVVETMRPVLEENKGKTLTKNEIIEGGRKAKVLEDVIGRDEAKQFAESLQASRNFLRSEQSQIGITPKFLEQLEIVSSNAADAGRRLQSFNIGAEDITIKEKVLKDILRIGADAKEVLEAGNKVDWNDAKQITDFYRKFKPATLAEKLDEYRYTNMLSSPNTQINNSFSNLLQTAVLAPIEKSIRGAVSFAEARLTGKEQEYFARQGVDYARGYWKALPEAWDNVKKEMSGISTLTKPDVDLIPTSNSRLRQIYTTPLRMLQASDQFFRTLVKGGEIESLKTQGITGAKASKIAEQQADYRTFRQQFDPDGKLGQNKVLQIWDKWNSVVSNLRNAPGGKYLVPFLQTPTNILKQGVEYSPLGFSTVIGSREPLTQLSKAIVGSAVFTGAYALADSGLTTWDTPTNSNERAEFYAAGLQPYSVKIGDKWVSYSKLGPLAYPIAMASALKWSKDNGADEDTLATMGKTMAGTLGFFADQSYVRGIGDMIDAFRGDEYKQSRALSNIPAQMIPYRSFMGWVARLVDPVYRKTSGGTIPEQIGKSLISQVPFASKSLEAYQTPFGTDSERQFPEINAVSPFSISQEKPKELEYYNARNTVRQDNKKVDKILKDIESGKQVDTSKVMTDQVVALTKKKIEAGIEVTDQELETAYLDKVIKMPSSNRYEKGMRDSDLWSKTGTILDDENLSDAQKQALNTKIATELGVTKEDIQLYQVAKQDNAPKTLYVLDQVETMQSPDEILQFLVKGRKPVNGKILASDGVIDNLVDDGIIPYELGKDLKKLDFDEKGTAKKKKTSSSNKKGKQNPIDKAYKNYLANLSKITLPSGKIRTQAPIKISVKGLTFGD